MCLQELRPEEGQQDIGHYHLWAAPGDWRRSDVFIRQSILTGPITSENKPNIIAVDLKVGAQQLSIISAHAQHQGREGVERPKIFSALHELSSGHLRILDIDANINLHLFRNSNVAGKDVQGNLAEGDCPDTLFGTYLHASCAVAVSTYMAEG